MEEVQMKMGQESNEVGEVSEKKQNEMKVEEKEEDTMMSTDGEEECSEDIFGKAFDKEKSNQLGL